MNANPAAAIGFDRAFDVGDDQEEVELKRPDGAYRYRSTRVPLFSSNLTSNVIVCLDCDGDMVRFNGPSA